MVFGSCFINPFVKNTAFSRASYGFYSVNLGHFVVSYWSRLVSFWFHIGHMWSNSNHEWTKLCLYIFHWYLYWFDLGHFVILSRSLCDRNETQNGSIFGQKKKTDSLIGLCSVLNIDPVRVGRGRCYYCSYI